MAKQNIWRTAVDISGGACALCSDFAEILFQIARPPLKSDRAGRWCCRICLLDPVRDIRFIDRRGDELTGTAERRQEVEDQVAIALYHAARDRADSPDGIDWGAPLEVPPLPAGYSHVLSALAKLAQVDTEFTGLREKYQEAQFFSPKQMLLVQWRLAKFGIEHEPQFFAVSTRSDKELSQVRGLEDWQRKKLAPYLSWSQRSRFGL
jgi:hypothetical protein